jgi:hypothetical protein
MYWRNILPQSVLKMIACDVTPCNLVEATEVSDEHSSSVCPEDELLDLTPCGL